MLPLADSLSKPPQMSQIAFIPILVCFVFRIIRMSLAAIPGLNSLVSVAGSWTLPRMHFTEFLKLFDIFALLNFSNVSSRGKSTNVLFNFFILLLGLKTIFDACSNLKQKIYKTKKGHKCKTGAEWFSIWKFRQFQIRPIRATLFQDYFEPILFLGNFVKSN